MYEVDGNPDTYDTTGIRLEAAPQEWHPLGKGMNATEILVLHTPQ